jgi:hypothetical protein
MSYGMMYLSHNGAWRRPFDRKSLAEVGWMG